MPSATSSRAPSPGLRRALGAGSVLVLLGAAWMWLPSRAGTDPPDILLVVWDTCRADRTSLDGYPLPTTPRLKALAAEGVTYRWCFTPSPWTPPAHASLFTGLLPSGHGLRETVGSRVRGDIPLLASTLREAGYRTVAVPANPVLAATGLLDGFETVLHGPPEGHMDPGTEVAARLEAWIRSRSGEGGPRRPYFLFVNLMDCHLPLHPSREDLVAVHGTAAEGVSTGGPGTSVEGAIRHLLGIAPLAPEEIRNLSLAYDGAVHAADRATGRILDILRTEGRYEGTFVAVVADHGECLGEQGEVDHHLTILDPVLRVPLVLRWPGRLDGGRTVEAQVRLQDLYPTLLEAAGVPAPRGCGRDAASLLAEPVVPREAVAEHRSFADSVPLLRRKFPDATEEGLERYRRTFLVIREAATGPSPRKLVVTGTAGRKEERLALFDLRGDPGEERDLLGPGERPGDRAAAEALRKRAR